MDRRLLFGTAFSTGAALALASAAHAQPAPNARPAGASVVAGAATIAQSATVTTVDQSTPRAAINWQSFNVGSRQTVQFDQPSSSAVALNRVIGPNPSQIAGRIDANGQVVLTNQDGVIFYKGSQVNTAGLMVSAAGIGNANFMAGRMVFDQAANPTASVTNKGSITVRDAGLAAFVAPQVANAGVINARLGHVILAGARTATLDLYGDGLMAIDVTGQVVQAPNGATALVTNTGVIRADGGTVQLTARAADGIVQTLVNAGGKIQAGTAGGRTGTIVLNGVGGSITVAGQLSATGSAPGSTGGAIEVDASNIVAVAPTARINASGPAGGGVIALGTTLARAKGGPGTASKHTAANVQIAPGATIAANATAKGNGGRVTILSAGTTVMDGAISATGGPRGGDGGFAEVSGTNLGMTGVVDLAAPAGRIGTMLLDPTNLDVIAATASLDADLPDITYATGAGSQTVSNRAIDDSTANVILQATNNLTVDLNAPIVLQPGVSLTMQTQTGNIVVNSPITASSGGNLTLQAGLTARSGGTLTLNSNLTTDEDAEVGRITLQADGGIALNATSLSAGTLDISNITAGGVSQATGGEIVVTTLQSTNGVAGNAGLTSTFNFVPNLGPLTVTGGTLTLNDETALTINGPIAADFLNISAVGQITLAGNIATLGAPLAQQSGATPAPAGSTLTVVTEPTDSESFAGFAAFVQTGTSMLTDQPGTTLRIQLPAAGGTATFANLAGPGANLVLGLGSGTATGAMQVGGLLVLGAGGSAALTGSVAGVTTAAAAALGQITPAVNAAYTFNGCAIGLAACAPAPVIPTPVTPTPITPTPVIPTPVTPTPVTPTPVTPTPVNQPGVIPPTITLPVAGAYNPPGIQAVLGGLSPLIPTQALPPLPTVRALGVIVLPTPPLQANQLAPPDVVPPNISFEDY